MIKPWPLRPRRVVLSVALALILSLLGCVRITPLPPQSTPPNLLPEIERYVNAHQRSLVLRTNIEGFSKIVRQESSAKGGTTSELLIRLQDLRREYFAVREALFEITFLHASAIVERPAGQDLRPLLAKTSLSLMAAADLLQNFDTVAAMLSENKALLLLWNEADSVHGIPEGSWNISLETSRNAQYHDLFREAIGRLQEYRRHLEGYRQQGEKVFLTLYPHGINAALQEAEKSYALLRAGFAEEDLAQDETELRVLVERSKTVRSDWATSAPLLHQAIAREGGLIRGNVHVRVHTAKREYLDLREALYHLAFKHVTKLTREDIPYPRPFRLRAVGISLLAAVTLYENSHHLQTHILTIPGVKALLNQGDPALGIPPGFWDNIEREFTRLEYRRLLEAGIKMLEETRNLPSGPVETDPFFAYVAAQIATSTAIPEIRGEGFLPKIARGLRSYSEQIQKMGFGVLGIAKLPLAIGLGSLVSIELRKGKLFDQPHWVEFVKERLKPGDLIVEKSPFRVTDKLIPGHFGHVALYVGTEADLRDLGLIRHPSVTKHLEQVRAGKIVIEALPDGTQINTIAHLLNTDDLAILRPKKDSILSADVLQAITLAFSHIGKRYDFPFDNNTWDTIVCSELAFQTYINVRWPVAKMLTSYTISPDDVAIFAGSDPSRPFDLITFIHDGQVVHDVGTGVINEKKYIDLLGRRYAAAGR